MYFAVPFLARIAIFFSIFNFSTWTIDWFRFNFGYFGPTFLALIPQLLLTLWLLLVAKRYEIFKYRILAPLVATSLWAITVTVNSWDLFFTDLEIPWSGTYSLLDSIGFPILELQYGGAAPLLGFFHSNQGDLNISSDWYFDGGIQISWFIFNLVVLLFIIFSARIAIEDRKDRPFR